MQDMVTEMLKHMSKSSQQLARMAEADSHVTMKLSKLVEALPDEHSAELPACLENTQALANNIAAYLTSIGDLEESIAAQLSFVIHGLKEADEEE